MFLHNDSQPRGRVLRKNFGYPQSDSSAARLSPRALHHGNSVSMKATTPSRVQRLLKSHSSLRSSISDTRLSFPTFGSVLKHRFRVVRKHPDRYDERFSQRLRDSGSEPNPTYMYTIRRYRVLRANHLQTTVRCNELPRSVSSESPN